MLVFGSVLYSIAHHIHGTDGKRMMIGVVQSPPKKERFLYLGSMLPFSVSVSQDPYRVYI